MTVWIYLSPRVGEEEKCAKFNRPGFDADEVFGRQEFY